MIVYDYALLLLLKLNRAVLAQAVEVLCHEAREERCRGGVVSIAVFNIENHDDHSFAMLSVGFPGKKLLGQCLAGLEKLRILWFTRELGGSNMASSDDKTAEKTPMGASVVFVQGSLHIYISFSGGTPEIDEALVCALGETLELSPLEGCKHKNPHLPRARELLQGVLA